jgi:hypothetical protein
MMEKLDKLILVIKDWIDMKKMGNIQINFPPPGGTIGHINKNESDKLDD